ncbi:MAG: hypothetical protein JWR12_3129 [Mucilaginibacter sp.]|nr:hypothetical protein [Mucilaginibacter sp.]
MNTPDGSLTNKKQTKSNENYPIFPVYDFHFHRLPGNGFGR